MKLNKELYVEKSTLLRSITTTLCHQSTLNIGEIRMGPMSAECHVPNEFKAMKDKSRL